MLSRRIFFVLFILLFSSFILYNKFLSNETKTERPNLSQQENLGGPKNIHPLSIEYMREQEYSGSGIQIEEELPSGDNYSRYIASYKSDGLKIYALLTIPFGEVPQSGFPVVIFNHGYIPPDQYRTTERYVYYVDGFARNGYIVFRSDYRGHGNSEGEASGGYGSTAYTVDVLNALASIKKLTDPQSKKEIVDENRIGMWGHSMGGHITLRSMVVSKDIKAGVIWAGVVASYSDLINNWRRRPNNPVPATSGQRSSWRQTLIDSYGTPEQNQAFWNSISPIYYVKDISGPIQLHHGTLDTSVPVGFSKSLYDAMKKENKNVENYVYEGDDHDITNNFNIAMQRSIEFFDKYVKGNTN